MSGVEDIDNKRGLSVEAPPSPEFVDSPFDIGGFGQFIGKLINMGLIKEGTYIPEQMYKIMSTWNERRTEQYNPGLGAGVSGSSVGKLLNGPEEIRMRAGVAEGGPGDISSKFSNVKTLIDADIGEITPGIEQENAVQIGIALQLWRIKVHTDSVLASMGWDISDVDLIMPTCAMPPTTRFADEWAKVMGARDRENFNFLSEMPDVVSFPHACAAGGSVIEYLMNTGRKHIQDLFKKSEGNPLKVLVVAGEEWPPLTKARYPHSVPSTSALQIFSPGTFITALTIVPEGKTGRGTFQVSSDNVTGIGDIRSESKQEYERNCIRYPFQGNGPNSIGWLAPIPEQNKFYERLKIESEGVPLTINQAPEMPPSEPFDGESVGVSGKTAMLFGGPAAAAILNLAGHLFGDQGARSFMENSKLRELQQMMLEGLELVKSNRVLDDMTKYKILMHQPSEGMLKFIQKQIIASNAPNELKKVILNQIQWMMDPYGNLNSGSIWVVFSMMLGNLKPGDIVHLVSMGGSAMVSTHTAQVPYVD